MSMKHSAKIFITGHCVMVGSALLRRPQGGGWDNLLLRIHAELELLDRRAVHAFPAEQQPEAVVLELRVFRGFCPVRAVTYQPRAERNDVRRGAPPWVGSWDNLSPVKGETTMRSRPNSCFAPTGLKSFRLRLPRAALCGFTATLCPGLVCSCPVGAEELPLTRRLMSVDYFLPAA